QKVFQLRISKLYRRERMATANPIYSMWLMQDVSDRGELRHRGTDGRGSVGHQLHIETRPD
ncbi:MAG TPA: hypothetical protein QGF35_08490, partial [Dehalococcoidia bacterium]|nr:hypothetical protein [Dehalococcoidia bacterium]